MPNYSQNELERQASDERWIYEWCPAENKNKWVLKQSAIVPDDYRWATDYRRKP